VSVSAVDCSIDIIDYVHVVYNIYDCSIGFIFSLQLDTDEVTVENSMSKSFDQIIRLQLDPVWNQLVIIIDTLREREP
jgi:hypothetical protein